MKKHAIIPIFIPNMGCNMSCVFCDQNQITARTQAPSPREVRTTIDQWLTTLRTESEDDPIVEIAFYGGSFTAIPRSMQESYLSIAKEYLDQKLIESIHISTRPDAIDLETLETLEAYGVKTIELGVQSFDEEVLERSKRGHGVREVYEACKLIKEHPGKDGPGAFNLGIQLMVGLPGSSFEKDLFSARETAAIKPELARIYPTLVLEGTELMDMYLRGEYKPLTREDAINRTKEVYRVLYEAGIYIMRVGLKSTDIINSENLGEINQGAYHPAFRQLVESEIAKEKIEALLLDLPSASTSINIFTSPDALSTAIGQNGSNKAYFAEKYRDKVFSFKTDESLSYGEYRLSCHEPSPKKQPASEH